MSYKALIFEISKGTGTVRTILKGTKLRSYNLIYKTSKKIKLTAHFTVILINIIQYEYL